jgi:ubiquinone biosynthesis protein COQ9
MSMGGGGALVRGKLLQRALDLVPTHGFTKHAVLVACDELSLSRAAAGALGARPPAEVAHFFAERCNAQLARDLAAADLDGLPVHVKVKVGLKARLGMVAPLREAWTRGLREIAHPEEAPRAARTLAEMVDEIWWHAGDRSTDVCDWCVDVDGG